MSAGLPYNVVRKEEEVTEEEAALVSSVRRHFRKAQRERYSGKLRFEVSMRNGGVSGRYIEEVQVERLFQDKAS